MSRILIVSNRLPVSVRKVNKRYEIYPSIGGLATGVAPFHAKHPSLWIGWSGIEGKVSPVEQKNIRDRLETEHRCFPVFYNQDQLKHFYYGTCNDTLWPLFHGFTETTKFDATDWESFVEVNRFIAQAVIDHYQSGDTIWIHDYQMLLVGNFIREQLPDAAIGFFLHIPFPAYDIFRLLPQRDQLIRGMLQYDLVGFHTYDYVQNFLDSVRRLTGYSHRLDQIATPTHLAQVDAFPLGIDYQRFARASRRPSVKKIMKKLRHDIGKRKMLLSLDRLDYTKGIVQRLNAFAAFLAAHPEHHHKVTLVLVLAIWRPKVLQYQRLKQNIDRLIGQINGNYGGTDWTPVRYVVRTIGFDELTALYATAEVALITPLRDGMNLVAKEYVATRHDNRGVLVLSEMAGAAEEMGEAVIVNPFDDRGFADAIQQAITMPPAEQRQRNRPMRKRLQRYSTQRWVDDYLTTLQKIKHEQAKRKSNVITTDIQSYIIKQFKHSKRRLVFLDYDGTLVEFVKLPQLAKPDRSLLRLLEQLTADPHTTVILNSGRDRQTMERWFKGIRCGFVAEHGAWLKDINKSWKAIDTLNVDWKEVVRPLLQLYVDRTPGSIIEEKHYALVWHYRGVKGTFAELRAHQLQEALSNLANDYNLRIIEGKAVVEVLPNIVNKGRAVTQWIQSHHPTFILAAGDDRTDEDVFKVLPKSAISVKVRLEPSQAKYSVASTTDMRSLLSQFIDEK